MGRSHLFRDVFLVTRRRFQRGFLKFIILLIIALALLKLVWDFDILEFLNRPGVKEVWDAIVNVFKKIWEFVKNLFDSAF